MIPNKMQFQQLQLSTEEEELEFLPLELSIASETEQIAESNSNIQSSPLQRFVETKIELKETEAKLESLELEAINEALNILSQNQDNNKNNVIFDSDIAKVVIGFRQKYESAKDNTKIARLEDEIQLAEQAQQKKMAAKLNQIDAQIQELENQIKQLEEQRDKLMTNKQLNRLKFHLFSAIQDSAYKQAYLSVHIKK
ncbi:hypothetical protein PCC9214_05458 (plasmid) [Planktothrix tepida]|uniref:Uncharacterized protein n=1 Tax=Planktothrix tepida PCC 9214 TaxID=671072 RepID=A0A1J1LN73_9CYAN|nr:hypothetical protein [Planktothrix tepida]CAD5988762.1 hypothetical protein PCC9214_05458 [Planktothrix tepida]CUR33939.1 conserved hypothetical protein [Planktothrix tepida PCC 9214]